MALREIQEPITYYTRTLCPLYETLNRPRGFFTASAETRGLF
jgi:hypothetical protein